MANSLTVKDAYTLINSIASQALGSTSLTATDTSSFVVVGETLLRTGLESTLNAISYVMAKTIFSTRPYRAKLSSLERDEERYGMITRKVTYLRQSAEASRDYNTDLNGSQLADGNSIDMYVIKAPKAVQLNFPGSQVLQDHITRFRDQLRIAFSNEEEFIRFWEGAMVEFYNTIETQKEAKSRAVLLNHMAGIISMNKGNSIDLVAEFNRKYGTTYTRTECLTTYAEKFWKFTIATIQIYSDYLTDDSSLYHANLTGYDPIPRHTPKDRQRMIMYSPAFVDAKAEIYSSLFNPEYLNIGDFEAVNYWQSKTAGPAINVKPNILNTSNGQSASAGSYVNLPYVLGMLYDEEALGIMPKFDYASVTPFNSAGGYFNLYMHWLFKMYSDFTENAIVFYLGEGGNGELRAVNIQCTYGGVEGTVTISPDIEDGVYAYTVTGNKAEFKPIVFVFKNPSHLTYTSGGVKVDGVTWNAAFTPDGALQLSPITFDSEGIKTITIHLGSDGVVQPVDYTITLTYDA